MSKNSTNKDIWVLGDYRNYFKNRVTLQILARARALAAQTGGQVCGVVFGDDVGGYAGEYIAHGADRVYVIDHPRLKSYGIETFTNLLIRLARDMNPDIILIGATRFGQEVAPRVAKQLDTGLTADCIDLEIDDKGRLVQIAPSFGGNLIARILTPKARPPDGNGAARHLP